MTLMRTLVRVLSALNKSSASWSWQKSMHAGIATGFIRKEGKSNFTKCLSRRMTTSFKSGWFKSWIKLLRVTGKKRWTAKVVSTTWYRFCVWTTFVAKIWRLLSPSQATCCWGFRVANRSLTFTLHGRSRSIRPTLKACLGRGTGYICWVSWMRLRLYSTEQRALRIISWGRRMSLRRSLVMTTGKDLFSAKPIAS